MNKTNVVGVQYTGDGRMWIHHQTIISGGAGSHKVRVITSAELTFPPLDDNHHILCTSSHCFNLLAPMQNVITGIKKKV